MASVSVRRLADSCVIVDDGEHVALVDPGIHTWRHPSFSLDDIVWLDRILITHQHDDHCHPEFVAALAARFPDVEIQSSRAVADVLRAAHISVTTVTEPWIEVEEAAHERLPIGEGPPNLAFHIGGWFTHPGDSRSLRRTNPVLAVPMNPPWSSMTEAMAFVNRLAPRFVFPIHDWNLNRAGLDFVSRVAPLSLESATFIDLGHFETVELDL